MLLVFTKSKFEVNEIIIEGYKYSNTKVLDRIAINDGFENWEEMKTFFTEDFIGKMIFWKNCVWL